MWYALGWKAMARPPLEMAGRGATIVRRTREWHANERVEVPVSHAPVIKYDEIPTIFRLRRKF
jgi:hypothetical protein